MQSELQKAKARLQLCRNELNLAIEEIIDIQTADTRPITSNELPADVLDEVRDALANLISVAERNIYPQPDKVNSDYAKLVSAKSALAKLSAMPSGWRPIETAPKDGTYILGCGPHDTRGHYIDVVHTYEGVWTITFMHGHGEPTHWRPLPTPPEGEK